MKTRRQALQYAAMGTAAMTIASEARAAGNAPAIFSGHWETGKTFTLKVAGAMPAADYEFKPAPDMRSYGQLMSHLAGAVGYYLGQFKGADVPASVRARQKQFDKDTVMMYLNTCMDFGSEVIKSLTDETLEKSFQGRPNTPPMTGWDLIFNAFIHTAHTRGYADVYLRLKGITPPLYSV
ncbi:MAG: DinB family protein [Bryobacteraceae bacterium]